MERCVVADKSCARLTLIENGECKDEDVVETEWQFAL